MCEFCDEQQERFDKLSDDSFEKKAMEISLKGSGFSTIKEYWNYFLHGMPTEFKPFFNKSGAA